MRAYGYLCRKGVSIFELDQTSVQQHKLAFSESAGIPCDHVSFVTVDFGKEGIFEKLIESGFDPAKKTLFLWEGVTLYLSEADVRKTMHEVQSKAANGSVLLADFYADSMVAKFKSGSAKKSLDYTGEGVDFSLNLAVNYEEELVKFVTSESMSVGGTFFLGRTGKNGPFTVVVEMKCEQWVFLRAKF